MSHTSSVLQSPPWESRFNEKWRERLFKPSLVLWHKAAQSAELGPAAPLIWADLWSALPASVLLGRASDPGDCLASPAMDTPHARYTLPSSQSYTRTPLKHTNTQALSGTVFVSHNHTQMTIMIQLETWGWRGIHTCTISQKYKHPPTEQVTKHTLAES